jgi:hypothetical protein
LERQLCAFIVATAELSGSSELLTIRFISSA